MIPAFFIFTTCLTTPFALERLVVRLSFGPLMRTLIPLTALPCLVRWIVSAVLRPTNNWCGVILLTATQYTGGGPTNGAVTCAVAVAWLLVVFVSGRSPATATVLVWVPVVL